MTDPQPMTKPRIRFTGDGTYVYVFRDAEAGAVLDTMIDNRRGALAQAP